MTQTAKNVIAAQEMERLAKSAVLVAFKAFGSKADGYDDPRLESAIRALVSVGQELHSYTSDGLSLVMADGLGFDCGEDMGIIAGNVQGLTELTRDLSCEMLKNRMLD